MKKVLIVGGANGIGLSIAKVLSSKSEVEKVIVVDKSPLALKYRENKIESYEFDLTNNDYSFFDRFSDIDGLIITAGFGRLQLFNDIPEEMIATYFNVNSIATIRVVKHFYNKLLSKSDFYCCVLVSISGFLSSPFFSLYGATKAALRMFIESVNVELIKAGSNNCILNVSPGSIKGTSFTKGETDLNITKPLAEDIISQILQKSDLFIPDYETVYKTVIERYRKDFRAEGLHSYEYKISSGRVNVSPNNK